MDHWTSRTVCECSEIAGSTWAPPQQPTISVLMSQGGPAASGWNRERRAVWDQVGLSHCRHNGLVTVRDEASLSRCHSDQSCRGHQCSKTTLTGESRFHRSTTLGIELGSLMTGSKWVDHWTSGTVCECSESAGSPQGHISLSLVYPIYWYHFQANLV
jgi:hypothetical protein